MAAWHVSSFLASPITSRSAATAVSKPSSKRATSRFTAICWRRRREGPARRSGLLLHAEPHPLIVVPRTRTALGAPSLTPIAATPASSTHAPLDGPLWQGRYGAVAMDEQHLHHAARYVALNPVRARLCDRAEEWLWSSAKAHLAGKDDGLVRVAPLLDASAISLPFLAARRTAAPTAAALRMARNDWTASRRCRMGRADRTRDDRPAIVAEKTSQNRRTKDSIRCV